MKPDAILEVEFYSAEDGGRINTLLEPGYSCVLKTSQKSGVDCRFLLEAVLNIEPHKSYEVAVKFLDPTPALANLQHQAEFNLWEGKIIGRGALLCVLREVE